MTTQQDPQTQTEDQPPADAPRDAEGLPVVQATLQQMNKRLDNLERITQAHRAETNTRIDTVNARIDAVNARIDTFQAETNTRFSRLEDKLDRLQDKLDRLLYTLIGGIIAVAVALIGGAIAVIIALLTR